MGTTAVAVALIVVVTVVAIELIGLFDLNSRTRHDARGSRDGHTPEARR